MTAKETERLVKVETKLDYIQEDIAEIKDILQAMSEQTSLEKEKVKVLEETVAPLTAWRRKIWAGVVGVIVVGALEIAILTNWIKELTK